MLKSKNSQFVSSSAPQAGIAVLISILLIGILVSVTLVLSSIFIPKIKLAGDVKKSPAALYSAESATEWCLFINRKVPPQSAPAKPAMNNGATYTNATTGNPLLTADCLNPSVRISGTYQGVSRIFEISF